jgi:hypothetical protein
MDTKRWVMRRPISIGLLSEDKVSTLDYLYPKAKEIEYAQII